ncbi:anti-sigma factor family protein [Ferruginibacter sp.]
MSINRHNYEAFFLLYVDNELSAADRNAVELFVQQNADLQEELSVLQQTVIKPDKLIFDNKSSLFKEEHPTLQENLLLYIDGELGKADELHVKKLVEQDDVAAKELAILQQTKLQPETIVFADKQSLYRKEGGRVVAFPWKRIAVAAILLGFGTWGTVSVLNKNNGTTETGAGSVASGTQTKTTAPVTVAPEKNTTAPVIPTPQQTVTNTNSTNVAVVNPATVIKSTTEKNNQPVTNKIQQPKTTAPKEDNKDVAVEQPEIKAPSNNLPKPDYNNFNNTNRNKADYANVQSINTPADKLNSGNRPSVDVQNNGLSNNTVVNGYALNTNFTEGDNDNTSADDEKAKKSKLGGLFRKVKRLVERTTNVKTGNGIKIAGFDIAIK